MVVPVRLADDCCKVQYRGGGKRRGLGSYRGRLCNGGVGKGEGPTNVSNGPIYARQDGTGLVMTQPAAVYLGSAPGQIAGGGELLIVHGGSC